MESGSAWVVLIACLFCFTLLVLVVIMMAGCTRHVCNTSPADTLMPDSVDSSKSSQSNSSSDRYTRVPSERLRGFVGRLFDEANAETTRYYGQATQAPPIGMNMDETIAAAIASRNNTARDAFRAYVLSAGGVVDNHKEIFFNAVKRTCLGLVESVNVARFKSSAGGLAFVNQSGTPVPDPLQPSATIAPKALELRNIVAQACADSITRIEDMEGPFAPVFKQMCRTVNAGIDALKSGDVETFQLHICNANSYGLASIPLIISALTVRGIFGHDGTTTSLTYTPAITLMSERLSTNFHYMYRLLAALTKEVKVSYSAANALISESLNDIESTLTDTIQKIATNFASSGITVDSQVYTDISNNVNVFRSIASSSYAPGSSTSGVPLAQLPNYFRTLQNAWSLQVLSTLNHFSNIKFGGVPVMSANARKALYDRTTDPTKAPTGEFAAGLRSIFREVLLTMNTGIATSGVALSVGNTKEAMSLLNAARDRVLSSLQSLVEDLHNDDQETNRPRIFDYSGVAQVNAAAYPLVSNMIINLLTTNALSLVTIMNNLIESCDSY